LPGLIQGVYAFYGIARFWRERARAATGADAVLAQFEFAVARRQTQESLQIALAAEGLSPLGRKFFTELGSSAARWTTDPVDPLTDELAEIATDSHRIGWLLRHFHPEPDDVAALVETWPEAPAEGWRPARARLRSHPDLRWDQRISAITRRCATASARGITTPPADGLAAGENALVSGDPVAANKAFTGWLAMTGAGDEAPTADEARAWVGLALSAEDKDAAGALTQRPDLVRAVCAQLKAVPPLEVAAMVGTLTA
jgi:hypothetical protein